MEDSITNGGLFSPHILEAANEQSGKKKALAYDSAQPKTKFVPNTELDETIRSPEHFIKTPQRTTRSE